MDVKKKNAGQDVAQGIDGDTSLSEQTLSPSESPPEPLSDAYHKARRSYTFFSGLLIAWELIGITLPADPFPQVKISFKSPEAAPFVFLILIFFFSFRTTIEYFQSDIRRRSSRSSKIDFYVAHAIGCSAVLIYGAQRLLEIQVWDIVKAYSVPFSCGLSISYTIGYFLLLRIQSKAYSQIVSLMHATADNRKQDTEIDFSDVDLQFELASLSLHRQIPKRLAMYRTIIILSLLIFSGTSLSMPRWFDFNLLSFLIGLFLSAILLFFHIMHVRNKSTNQLQSFAEKAEIILDQIHSDK